MFPNDLQIAEVEHGRLRVADVGLARFVHKDAARARYALGPAEVEHPAHGVEQPFVGRPVLLADIKAFRDTAFAGIMRCIPFRFFFFRVQTQRHGEHFFTTAAQQRQHEVNGVNRTYYCGAYWRYVKWPEGFNVAQARDLEEFFVHWIDVDERKEVEAAIDRRSSMAAIGSPIASPSASAAITLAALCRPASGSSPCSISRC